MVAATGRSHGHGAGGADGAFRVHVVLFGFARHAGQGPAAAENCAAWPWRADICRHCRAGAALCRIPYQLRRYGGLPARMLEQDHVDGQGRAFRVPDAQGRQRRNPGRTGHANQGRRTGGACDHCFPRGVPHSGGVQGIQQGAFQCLCAHRRYFCARASGRGRTHAGAFRSVRPVHGQRSDQRRLVLGSLRRGPGRDRRRSAGRTGHGLCLAGGRSEAVCFRHRAPDRRRFGAVRLAAGPWRGHE